MLKIKNLTKSFNKHTENEINIFKNLNIEFEKNKCTAIVGPNGCGKSTLLNIISGKIKQDSGQIILNKKDISNLKEKDRSKYISRVFQDPSMGVSPSLTVLENLSLANKKGERFKLKKLLSGNRDYYFDLLKNLNLGLEDKLDIKVKYLSGGQRQSLSLIMATLKKPDVLLLDEHTAALDPKTSSTIMEITQSLIKTHNITTIMISHNMEDALKYSENLVMLNKGKVILKEKSSNLTSSDLLSIYKI